MLDGVRSQDPDAAEAAMRSLLDKAASDEGLLQAETKTEAEAA